MDLVEIKDLLKTEKIKGDMYKCDYIGKPLFIEEGDYIRTKEHGWQQVKKVVKKDNEVHYCIKVNKIGFIDIYPLEIIEFEKTVGD